MKRSVVILFVFLFLCRDVMAQDSIIYYNGRHATGKITEFSTGQTVFRMEVNKKKRTRLKVIDKADIFAVYFKDSSARILYSPDVTVESDMTISEMESFIAGENLARYRYRAPWATACGVVSGLGGVYLGFWGFTIPAAYVGVVSAIPVKATRKKYFPPERISDEAYVEGFKYAAKRKKLKNALIGGGIGVATLGVALAILTSVYYID